MCSDIFFTISFRGTVCCPSSKIIYGGDLSQLLHNTCLCYCIREGASCSPMAPFFWEHAFSTKGFACIALTTVALPLCATLFASKVMALWIILYFLFYPGLKLKKEQFDKSWWELPVNLKLLPILNYWALVPFTTYLKRHLIV